jgi:sulfur-oxidizing protein SoxB
MVRVGGVSFTVDVAQSIGRRISDLTSLKTGDPLDAAKEYVVTGWASVNEGTEGPAIWDVVMRYIEKKQIVAPKQAEHVRVVGN